MSEATSTGSAADATGSGAGNGTSNSVSYESHQKLLDQHKKSKDQMKDLEAKLKAFEDEKKLVEENKLREQGEYKKILDTREAEISKLRSESESFKKSLFDGAKLQAVVDKLPGKIRNKQYYSFIDVDSIAIDPETHQIDEKTVELAANNFLKNHSFLIETKAGGTPPSDAAAGENGNLAYEDWLKMSSSDKKKNLHRVAGK